MPKATNMMLNSTLIGTRSSVKTMEIKEILCIKLKSFINENTF